MRNLSYMGRVVVKLIIIGIIAFVVITTAVFIINKYNHKSGVEQASNGTATVKEEGKTEKSEGGTGGDKQSVTLPGATADTDKITDTNKMNDTNKKVDANKLGQAQNQEATATTSTGELPKTGPADVVWATFVVALVVFSGSTYLVSRKAL